jgi:hypothetical protein
MEVRSLSLRERWGYHQRAASHSDATTGTR